jgi:hypothetical protein
VKIAGFIQCDEINLALTYSPITFDYFFALLGAKFGDPGFTKET